MADHPAEDSDHRYGLIQAIIRCLQEIASRKVDHSCASSVAAHVLDCLRLSGRQRLARLSARPHSQDVPQSRSHHRPSSWPRSRTLALETADSGQEELYHLGETVADSMMERTPCPASTSTWPPPRRRRPSTKSSTTTQGLSRLSVLDRHYNSWCCLPVIRLSSASMTRPNSILCAAVFRPRRSDRRSRSEEESSSSDQYGLLTAFRCASAVSPRQQLHASRSCSTFSIPSPTLVASLPWPRTPVLEAQGRYRHAAEPQCSRHAAGTEHI